jgi:hypothetical protein
MFVLSCILWLSSCLVVVTDKQKRQIFSFSEHFLNFSFRIMDNIQTNRSVSTKKETVIINIYLFVKYCWVRFGVHSRYIRYEKRKQFCRCIRQVIAQKQDKNWKLCDASAVRRSYHIRKF